jgi:hypothetical protein
MKPRNDKLVASLLTPKETAAVAGGDGYAMKTSNYCKYVNNGENYKMDCTTPH